MQETVVEEVCWALEIRACLGLNAVGVSAIPPYSLFSLMLPRVLCAGLKVLLFEIYYSILRQTYLSHDMEHSP